MTTTSGLNYFKPYRQYISSIVPTGTITKVTTTEANNYLPGLFVRLVYPESFGMVHLINRVFKITIVDSTSFTIEFDSSKETPFSIPIGAKQPAEVIPVGEEASTLQNAVRSNGTSLPEYSWTNTTFPWVNRS